MVVISILCRNVWESSSSSTVCCGSGHNKGNASCYCCGCSEYDAVGNSGNEGISAGGSCGGVFGDCSVVVGPDNGDGSGGV